MAETDKVKVRGNSKPNVKRRGSTYTYYLYVVGPDGKRRQHSRGGFKTQREAEEARIAAEYTLATGTYVKAERISLADFLVDEWPPTRQPPVLGESTWHSYDRYIRLHVIPHIGAIPVQKLSPVDLNQLYRLLLESGRCRRVGHSSRRPEVGARAVALRADGLTYEQVADQLRTEYEDEARITKHAVAALIRRQTAEPCEPDGPRGLSPRTVRHVHTILRAALKDALRWNLVARNVADAATPPSAAAVRSHRPKAWTAEQLGAFLDYTSDSQYLPAWIFLATSGCRRGECLGLWWSDIDLDEATAIIARQVTALDHRGS